MIWHIIQAIAFPSCSHRPLTDHDLLNHVLGRDILDGGVGRL
jgi:hypothetical protein